MGGRDNSRRVEREREEETLVNGDACSKAGREREMGGLEEEREGDREGERESGKMLRRLHLQHPCSKRSEAVAFKRGEREKGGGRCRCSNKVPKRTNNE